MFIAIEGCIGTGKTTLAKLLSEHYKGKFLLEQTRKHPFIADFYFDPEAYAFQTEMNFILIHYHQFQKAQKEGVFKSLVFSDFLFDKDRIFADLTLQDPEEQRLFTLTYDILRQRIPFPDLLICLKAQTEFLFERIKRRGREFEANLTFDYLDSVNSKYNDFFERYKQSEKIILNTQDIDTEDDKGVLLKKLEEKIISLINAVVSPGPA